MKIKLGDEFLAKLDTSARISEGIQRWWPRANAHHVWYHYQKTSRHSRLRWDTNLYIRIFRYSILINVKIRKITESNVYHG